MSVQVTLNCPLKANSFQELKLFLETNLPNVRGFKGNLRVSVLFDETNNEMLLDEEWLSVESHQTYLKFIEDNGVLAQLASFLSEPPQIKYFQRVEL